MVEDEGVDSACRPIAVDLDMLLLPGNVHEAAGMVSVQLGLTIEEAIEVLRVRARRYGLDMADLGERVITGEIRFAPRR
ncbi:hypothetical protein [Amycolatopsis aidingensis]|uniref:hypothetical protein n=1 Tax=Amycolatopsis aidingensis TaxID=2842453 RepID=UPI001C0A9D33|nr:hypothetical protein [Amycolatopsis aidingensis]